MLDTVLGGSAMVEKDEKNGFSLVFMLNSSHM